MSALHIFNPSHDEALAANSPHYYPSGIARKLAAEWGTLPAVWAAAGDAVWLPDEAALPADVPPLWRDKVRFVHRGDMNAAFWQSIDRIEPWGWDRLVCQQLRKAGAPDSLLPTEIELDVYRALSSRRTTTAVLPLLRKALSDRGVTTVGGSYVAECMDDFELLADQCAAAEHATGKVVAKSLWSCSGRGVFVIDGPMSASTSGRVKRLLREQGGIEVEPHYCGVLNFALEFNVLHDGSVRYAGLSLFDTTETGGYTGNTLAPQAALERVLARQFDGLNILKEICSAVLSQHIAARYEGPLGVDMMLVKTDKGIMLHPCIEVNLRRTMGYVALDVARAEYDLPSVLRPLFG